MPRKWYRADTGYRHEPGTTAGDVVRYEQDELGNTHMGVSAKRIAELDKYPARCIIWVAATRKAAKEYGKPEVIMLPDDIEYVAEDNCGGWLFLVKEWA